MNSNIQTFAGSDQLSVSPDGTKAVNASLGLILSIGLRPNGDVLVSGATQLSMIRSETEELYSVAIDFNQEAPVDAFNLQSVQLSQGSNGTVSIVPQPRSRLLELLPRDRPGAYVSFDPIRGY